MYLLFIDNIKYRILIKNTNSKKIFEESFFKNAEHFQFECNHSNISVFLWHSLTMHRRPQLITIL